MWLLGGIGKIYPSGLCSFVLYAFVTFSQVAHLIVFGMLAQLTQQKLGKIIMDRLQDPQPELPAGPGNYDPNPVAGYKVDLKTPFLGKERFPDLEKEGDTLPTAGSFHARYHRPSEAKAPTTNPSSRSAKLFLASAWLVAN